MEKKRKKAQENFYPVAMTIAGSDSGGGAGIQADLRTFNAFGVFGCSAVTAITSQNPAGVSRIDLMPPGSVSAQIGAVCSEIRVAIAKTGMLGSAAIVEEVAEAAEKYQLRLICDPVMISTSGKALLEPDALEVMDKKLLPKAEWITPNIPEAEFLSGMKIDSEKSAVDSAMHLYDKYGAAVLLKGGHAKADSAGRTPAKVSDVICYKGRIFKASSFRVDCPQFATHGTGCTLSAALCAALALEMPWKEALCESKAFVMGALVENIRIGRRIHAMYPPTNDYMGSIQLEEVDIH